MTMIVLSAGPSLIRVLAPAPRTNHGTPPVEDWERDGVLTELARIALEIRLDGVAELPCTARLTAFQRDEIAVACRRASETPPPHGV
ncbi:MAG: hypothetical protein OEM67_01800 [Thermoleophilia bacterium]|nr:hypothetical protein [Thermoleophilia bacterium]MDH3725686.1 hypothetical protein [Thermoleophilia bacterium]